MTATDISAEDRERVTRVYEDLRVLAEHPIPHLRAGARLALAEVSQMLNACGISYALYTSELSV